jgi:hypothetical protein
MKNADEHLVSRNRVVVKGTPYNFLSAKSLSRKSVCIEPYNLVIRRNDHPKYYK